MDDSGISLIRWSGSFSICWIHFHGATSELKTPVRSPINRSLLLYIIKYILVRTVVKTTVVVNPMMEYFYIIQPFSTNVCGFITAYSPVSRSSTAKALPRNSSNHPWLSLRSISNRMRMSIPVTSYACGFFLRSSLVI